MSLTFDHKVYGYNELSRSILFSATDGEHDIQFALPRINLEAFVGQEFSSDNEMWEVFHANRAQVEATATDYWQTISDQHRREGTAAPFGTPLVLPMLNP